MAPLEISNKIKTPWEKTKFTRQTVDLVGKAAAIALALIEKHVMYILYF